MSSKVTCTCGWSWNKSDSSKKDMYVCHQCGKDNSMKDGGWLSKFDVPEAENGIEGTMAGLTDKGFNYNGAWGGTMAMGGSLPGSVGFTYARTQDPAPSKGKYAKKTMASAQNGQEMKFYQEGLDWKPKTISRDGGWLSKYEEGGIIEDDRGQWEHPGEITKINSNEITMQGVDYPVLGISDTGDTQMMYPNQDYTYDGESVTEVPMMQKGGKASLRSLINDEGLKSKSDATKVVPQKTMTKEQADKFKVKKDAEELQRRKQAIETSNAARNKPLSIQNIADESGAIGDKFRMFPDDPNSFIDEYINPGVMIGNMASGLGRIPLNLQEGNYGEAAMSVAAPIATGALAGIGAKNTGQFVNNLVNPLGDIKSPFKANEMSRNIKNSISDYLQGFDRGLADIVKGRPVFETFPITSKQKAKMLSRQDEEFNKGIKFAEDWNYENFKMRPEVEKRIIDIDDVISTSMSNMNYFSKRNPIYNTKNILMSSRKGDVEKMVSKNEITEDIANYIKENRGRIGGVNSFPESITLRNHGAYAITPEHIGDVATHELGHSMQKLGSDWSGGWGNATTEFDSDLYKYYSANPNTKIGSEFKQAMVSPKKGKYVWEASPNELHSELMVARKNLYNNLTTSMLKRGDDPKDAMELLQNPSDEVIDYMINSQDLNRFFKKKTSQEEKRRLIKLLPAAIPVTGTVVALQQKEKNGGWLSKYN